MTEFDPDREQYIPIPPEVLKKRREQDRAGRLAHDALGWPGGVLTVQETKLVTWYSCSCDVRSKYCDENHRQSTRIPTAILAWFSADRVGT